MYCKASQTYQSQKQLQATEKLMLGKLITSLLQACDKLAAS